MEDYPEGRHVAGALTRAVVEYVDRRLGADGVAATLAGAGETRSLEMLRDDMSWTSHDQFVRLARAAGEVFGDVEELASLYAHAEIAVSGGPELVALVQELGSPQEFMRMVAASAHFASVERSNEELGPTSCRASFRTRPGFPADPALCAFMRGIVPMGVRLFGFNAITVEEQSCQCRGDDWCSITVSWDGARDLEFQLEEAKVRWTVAEKRLAAVHDTIERIVSADDLDVVLDRIVHLTSRASMSPAHVLEVHGVGTHPRHYVHGIDEAEARAIVAKVDAGAEGFVAVEVASATRRYGRLIVVDAAGGAGVERPALERYARLASTALDSAVALADARREAAISAALLDLSASLTEAGSPTDVAAKVANAMPAVVDCDASAVVLISDGVLDVAAQQGFDEAAFGLFEWSPEYITQFGLDTFRVHVFDAIPETARRVVGDGTFAAFATAPIELDGEIAGLLVAGVRDSSARFTEDLHLAQRFFGLAGQASIALRNARLVEQIRHQSLHDPLTGLPNRALILDRAEQMLARAARASAPCAALFLDLDGFKEINDSQGHEAGDHLLQAVAERLRAVVRDTDTFGRLGGDEFVVLADGASLDGGVGVLAERLLDALREPFELSPGELPVTVRASIGIAMGDDHSAGDLLRDADTALYRAKAAGKGCYRLFDPQMHEAARTRGELAEALGHAARRGEFFVEYQPIFDLASGKITSVEALLRWQHPVHGVVMPDDFVPYLEESGMIIEVGRWVLQEACREAARWHAAGHRIDVSVNASIRQLERESFVDEVRDALQNSGVASASLIVEITETALMVDADVTLRVLSQLRAQGVRIAIDDFGSGHSSLAYLRQFPVDALKIDRSFVDDMTISPASAELVRALVRLAQALGLETIAEGIEDAEQLERLRDEGCNSGQGFLLAHPRAADDVISFLAERRVATPTT